MQFNLVNDQEQVVQFVRCGVAWHGVALALGCCRGYLKRCVARVFYGDVGCLPRPFLGSSSGQRLLCVLDVPCAWPRGFGLAQRSVWWRSCAF